MTSPVECRSGYAYAERPVALWWEGDRLEIANILSQAKTPEGKYFRVRTQDESTFELFYAEVEDEWRINQL